MAEVCQSNGRFSVQEPGHFPPQQGVRGSKPLALNLQFQGPSCGLIGAGEDNSGASFPCCDVAGPKGLC